MKETSINGRRCLEKTLPPHPHLPKLEPPRGTRVSSEESTHHQSTSPEIFFAADLLRLIRQSRNAISKRLSLLHQNDGVVSKKTDVTEFEISGVKVLAKLKGEEEEIRGRITFFSRSNCRDSTAVRSFLRERGFDFSEINVDVYASRERELVERTGSSRVPQIFFNEKHFGGLMALNSLRNSGEFDRRIKELLGEKCCGGDAPAPVMYGFDEEEEEEGVGVDDEIDSKQAMMGLGISATGPLTEGSMLAQRQTLKQSNEEFVQVQNKKTNAPAGVNCGIALSSRYDALQDVECV